MFYKLSQYRKSIHEHLIQTNLLAELTKSYQYLPLHEEYFGKS